MKKAPASGARNNYLRAAYSSGDMEAAVFGALWLIALAAYFVLTSERQREVGLLALWGLLAVSALFEVGRAIAALLT